MSMSSDCGGDESGQRAGPPPCFADDVVDEALFDEAQFANVARGLAHPTRVAIIELFADSRPRMTQEIVDASGFAQSTISEHLRILRLSGMLVARSDGPRVWYCVQRSVLRRFAHEVTTLAGAGRTREAASISINDRDQVPYR